MPAASALSVGPLNAFLSTRQTAMPSAFPAIAVFMALTISPTSAVLDPVHWNVVFRSALASSMPYCVGTKNGFVVTWLTKTNLYFGVFGKFPAPASELLLPELSSLDLPHAASAVASMAAPPLASAIRREMPRCDVSSGSGRPIRDPSCTDNGPPPLLGDARMLSLTFLLSTILSVTLPRIAWKGELRV